jgi:hypothetical protein
VRLRKEIDKAIANNELDRKNYREVDKEKQKKIA